MKLRLEQRKSIAILDISEDVDSANVRVLHAGISKLLKSGKNQIVLNLNEIKRIQIDVLKEILQFHLLAAELGGDIVVVGQGALVKQAIQSYSSPPPVRYFATVDAAVAAFQSVVEAKGQRILEGSELELSTQLQALQKENTALKAKAQGRNIGELKKLQRENKALQSQIRWLEDQVVLLSKEKKKVQDIPPIASKVTDLEKALITTLAKEGLVKA